MKFLKTHTGAMVVLAVAVVLSVLFGSHRSLVQAREKVETERFASIAEDLQDCLDITANLLTVAGRYLDGSDLTGLADSREALADAGDIPAAHAAYVRLLGDAETLFLKLEDAPSAKRTGTMSRASGWIWPPRRTPSPGTATTPRRRTSTPGCWGPFPPAS